MQHQHCSRPTAWTDSKGSTTLGCCDLIDRNRWEERTCVRANGDPENRFQKELYKLKWKEDGACWLAVTTT